MIVRSLAKLAYQGVIQWRRRVSYLKKSRSSLNPLMFSPDVSIKPRALAESEAAIVTFVRFLPRMHPSVLFQIINVATSFSTKVAILSPSASRCKAHLEWSSSSSERENVFISFLQNLFINERSQTRVFFGCERIILRSEWRFGHSDCTCGAFLQCVEGHASTSHNCLGRVYRKSHIYIPCFVW